MHSHATETDRHINSFNRDTIAGLWARQVAMRPDEVAVIDPHRRLSFRQLDDLSCAIASMFPADSPDWSPNRRVGIIMDHSAEMIAAMLAVLKAGMAYVPAEPSFPIERIRFMMHEAGIRFLITNPHYSKLFTDVAEVVVEVPLPLIHCKCEADSDIDVMPSDAAYVLYTSGTTGKPKGVVATNANVAHYVRAFDAEFHPAPGDRMLQYSVCSFDIFVEEVFTTILSGATLVIPPLDVKDNVYRLLDFCNRMSVTIISGFPYMLLDFNRIGRLPGSLRLLISGGDVLRANYINRLRDKGVMIYNTYGPSETTVCAAFQRCDNIDALPDGTFPIGHPVLETEVKILDPYYHTPLPDGNVGEICISGAGVTDGYLVDCPESRNFATSTGDARIYHSGDLGYRLPDGKLAFLRRMDSQVMILGKRVECDEVENVLNLCPGIEKGLVRAYIAGDGLSYLVAYIVAKHETTFSLAEARQEMLRHLTPFMIPEFFILMKDIPLSPNGKPDSEQLPVPLKETSI